MAKKKTGGGKGRPHHGKSKQRSRAQRQSASAKPQQEEVEASAGAAPKAKAPSKRPASAPKAKPAAPKNPDRGPTRQERIEARRRAKRRKEQMTRIGLPVLIIAAIIGFAILARGGSGGTGPSETDQIEVAGQARQDMIPVGEKVPMFRAPALGGGDDFNLVDYQGEPYVLSVWAPWCPHCQKELPIVDRISRDFPAVPVVTVTTAIDQGTETPEDFMTERNLSFPVAVDDATQTIAEALGATSYPTIYFVGPNDEVVKNFAGEMPEAQVVEGFEALDELVPKSDAGDGDQGDGPTGSATPSPEKTPKDEPTPAT